MTLQSIIISGTTRTNHDGRDLTNIRSQGWFYVALSRARRAVSVLLDMTALPLSHLSRRRHDIDTKMTRLHALYTATAARTASLPVTT